ncbi:MAG: hypothetical protein ABSH05_06850 [Bryobacteraceae bacterium]|jgi:hypothetical protein
MHTPTHIAFETRRLHKAMDLKDERFVPREVTSLVKPYSAWRSRWSSDSEPPDAGHWLLALVPLLFEFPDGSL